MQSSSTNQTRLGLAFGSGSARGWSHIGIIRALADAGIEPDIVCGCSIGALVGASFVAGNLDRLEHWVTSLNKLDVAKFFELNLSLNGFVSSDRFSAFLQDYVCDGNLKIEKLNKRYAAVSTDLATGREVWFTDGPLIAAVGASIAVPGLFPPVRHQGRWLVDGGLVNPVPVSVCRALGADIVIAVNLNGDIAGKHFQARRMQQADVETHAVNSFRQTFRSYSSALFPGRKPEDQPPGLFAAIASSFNITQDRITRSRMAGDPPDLLLAPRLAGIGLLEFHRAAEAIKVGRASVQRALPDIQQLLEQ
jgi:NTE family protein